MSWIEHLALWETAALLLLHLLAGAPQRRRAGASWGQLALSAAITAGSAMLPVGVAFLLAAQEPQLLEDATLGVSVGASALLLGLLQLRFLELGVSQLPPAVQSLGVDPLAARIQELACGLGVGSVPVHEFPTLSAGLRRFAWAGGLCMPCLVVARALRGLQPGRRDAILAHELAGLGLARQAPRVLCGPLALGLGIGLSPWVGGPVGAVAGLALWVLCDLPLARADVLARDRRVVELLGVEAMRDAMNSTAPAPPPLPEPWGGWARAVGAVPSRIKRASGLAPDQARQADVELAKLGLAVRPRGDGGWIAWGLGVGVLVLGLLQGLTGPPVAACLLLATVPAAPGVAWVAATRRPTRRLLRRERFSSPGRWLDVACGVLALVGGIQFARYVFEAPRYSVQGWVVSSAVLGLPLLPLVWKGLRSGGDLSTLQRVVKALRAHAWDEVLAVCDACPGAVERDPRIELNLALAEVRCGRRALAEDRLDALRARLPLAGVNLGLLLLVRAPERSLELGEEAEQRLPGDPLPVGVQARALARLGREPEARDAIARAQADAPGDGSLIAVGAEAAIRIERLDLARIEVTLAEGITPGLAYTSYVAALLAQRAGDPDARVRLEAAQARAAAAPLSFLDEQLAELEAELTGAGPGAVDPPETAP